MITSGNCIKQFLKKLPVKLKLFDNFCLSQGNILAALVSMCILRKQTCQIKDFIVVKVCQVTMQRSIFVCLFLNIFGHPILLV